jgi:hypothetical protein
MENERKRENQRPKWKLNTKQVEIKSNRVQEE